MRWIGLVGLGLVASAAQANIESHFDAGAEGWSAENGSFPGLSVLESHSAGWSSGHLAETEASFTQPGLFVLAAPTNYLGNLSGYYGGTVSFALSDTQTDANVSPSLLLRGNGIALGYLGSQLPMPGGTQFSVPLTESGWFTLTGAPATHAQFVNALSNLNVFAINADWTTAGTDVVTLDNVVVAPVPEPASMAVLGLGLVGVMRRRRS